jgi:hypothetical protein
MIIEIPIITTIMTKEEEDTTTEETITKDQETPVTFPTTIKTLNNSNTTTDTTINNISQTQINPKDETPTIIDKTIKCKIHSIKTTALEIITTHTQEETIIMAEIELRLMI